MPKILRYAEIILSLSVTCGLAVLILAQVGLYKGDLQPVNSWYGEEYRADVQSVAAFGDEPYGVVTWELADYSRLELAEIRRNGVTVAVFNQPQVTFRVYDGDVLTLDAAAYRQPVRVRLQKVSVGIDGAFLLQDVEACGEVIELGRIVME